MLTDVLSRDSVLVCIAGSVMKMETLELKEMSLVSLQCKSHACTSGIKSISKCIAGKNQQVVHLSLVPTSNV